MRTTNWIKLPTINIWFLPIFARLLYSPFGRCRGRICRIINDVGNGITNCTAIIAVILNNITRTKNPNYGFGAYKNTYVDMVEAGIIDPTKVTRSALQNAASIASTLLTTESIVTDIPEPVQPMPQGGAGGMGGMY